MKHGLQSINVSLKNIESVDTRDFQTQVHPTVEAVSYHLMNACVAILAQEVEYYSPNSFRNVANNSTVLDHRHAKLVMSIVQFVLQ